MALATGRLSLAHITRANALAPGLNAIVKKFAAPSFSRRPRTIALLRRSPSTATKLIAPTGIAGKRKLPPPSASARHDCLVPSCRNRTAAYGEGVTPSASNTRPTTDTKGGGGP